MSLELDLNLNLNKPGQSEFFWPLSMPPKIYSQSGQPGIYNFPEEIPLANYGKSHIGQLKTLYRKGLSYRYGKKMQVIAGLHYNFSFSESFFNLFFNLYKAHNDNHGSQNLREIADKIYFILIRNYFKNYWILAYLFGASPAFDHSLFENEAARERQITGPQGKYLNKFIDETWIGPYATSLRMSDLGYQNSAALNCQNGLCVSFESPKAYAESLKKAVSTPYQAYQELEILNKKNSNHERIQLNDHFLQIENEYYSPIRPKQILESGERPAEALCRRGVRYIEVRVLDLNPFTPLGITPTQTAFLDVFLTYCALSKDEPWNLENWKINKQNFKTVTWEGRSPGCMLNINGEKIGLKKAAEVLFSELLEVAEIMDLLNEGQKENFRQAVLEEFKKVQNVDLTPSAKVLNFMQTQQMSHQALGVLQMQAHREYFEEIILNPCWVRQMDQMVRQSYIDEQKEVLNSKGDFESFLKKYLMRE